MDEKKKILAINFGGIGDEIFFLPTLISLKKQYPNSEITLALEPRSKGVKDLTDAEITKISKEINTIVANINSIKNDIKTAIGSNVSGIKISI